MSSVSIFVLPLIQVDAGPASERTSPAPTPGKDLCRLVVGRSPDQRSLSTRQAQATFAQVTYGKGQNTCAHSSWHISGTNKVTGNQQLIVLTVKTGTSKAIATGHSSGSYQGAYSSVEFQRTTPHTPSPGFIFLLPVLQYSDREQQYLERNLTAKKQTSRNAQFKQECRTGSEAFTCE